MTLERIKAKFPNCELRNEHPFYMMDAINDVPGCLAACLTPEFLDKIHQKINGFKPERIFTVGCGTSFHASQAAAYTFRTLLNIPSIAFDSLDFELDLPPGVDSQAMVIAISLSGQSITTCHALEKARNLGAMTIGVSGNPDSRLAKAADLAVTDPYLNEYPLGKTRSYHSTALMAMLVGVMTASQKNCAEFIANTTSMVQLLGEYAQYWQETGKSVAAKWAGVTTHYMLAGFGVQKANADELGLKLIEVLGENAIGFALEEFTHGPNASFSKDMGIILFQTDDRSLERALRVANGVALSEASLVVITNQTDVEWPQQARIVKLPELKQAQQLGLFPAAVAAQNLMYNLAIEKGLNPDINGHDLHPERGAIFEFFFPPGTH